MSAPIIVFDLDGTLVDTAPISSTPQRGVRSGGLAAVAYQTARNLIGGGARAMIARGIEAEGRVFDQPKLEQMFDDFIAYYSAHVADRSRPFPGLVDALDNSPPAVTGLRCAPTNSKDCRFCCSKNSN